MPLYDTRVIKRFYPKSSAGSLYRCYILRDREVIDMFGGNADVVYFSPMIGKNKKIVWCTP